MLIIGTGGLASDILLSLSNEVDKEDIVLFNEINDEGFDIYKDKYRIITNREQASKYLKVNDNRFIVGIGDNKMREQLAYEFTELGGENKSFISKYALVGNTAKIHSHGVFVMMYVSISHSAELKEGSIIYTHSGVGHSSIIGRYTLISASVFMSNTKIGDYSMVGIGVNFKPGISLGNNCIVGTGAIVTKSFESDSIIYGFPAKKM